MKHDSNTIYTVFVYNDVKATAVLYFERSRSVAGGRVLY